MIILTLLKVRAILTSSKIIKIAVKAYLRKLCPILVGLGVDFWLILGPVGTIFEHLLVVGQSWTTKTRRCLGRFQRPTKRRSNQQNGGWHSQCCSHAVNHLSNRGQSFLEVLQKSFKKQCYRTRRTGGLLTEGESEAQSKGLTRRWACARRNY